MEKRGEGRGGGGEGRRREEKGGGGVATDVNVSTDRCVLALLAEGNLPLRSELLHAFSVHWIHVE